MRAEPDGSTDRSHSPQTTALYDDSAPLGALGRWIRQVISRNSEQSLKQALQEMLSEHDENGAAVESEELTLLRNMVSFGELKVSDVMIPRTDIVAVNEATGLDELKQLVAKERHTRLPVYQDSLDHITGFIHIKDLLMCLACDETNFDLKQMQRTILFVPTSMKIIDLLLKMRLSSCHIAMVIDEYGGTDGLVTMEDLFEEIVGEIHDEHDDDEPELELTWINDKTLVADARVDVDDLVQELKVDLMGSESDDDFDTIGGLLFSHLGRIPAKGEVIEYGPEVKFEILSADPRRIKKVRVVRQSVPEVEPV